MLDAHLGTEVNTQPAELSMQLMPASDLCDDG